jgi:hypothetical protein
LIYEEILLYHFPKRYHMHQKSIKNNTTMIQDVLNSIHSNKIWDDQDDDYDENDK